MSDALRRARQQGMALAADWEARAWTLTPAELAKLITDRSLVPLKAEIFRRVLAEKLRQEGQARR